MINQEVLSKAKGFDGFWRTPLTFRHVSSFSSLYLNFFFFFYFFKCFYFKIILKYIFLTIFTTNIYKENYVDNKL